MNKFTYEINTTQQQYETYEWDNTWIDNANDLSTKRILYIGDSISCGIRNIANAKINKKTLFDGIGTSKGIDNPYFKDLIKIFAMQEKRRDVVIFNNGLHGWHLNDNTEYKYHYNEMVKFLLLEFKNTPLFIALTTHISDSARENRVICRNNVAVEIANQHNLPIIDLFSTSLRVSDSLLNDGVHFTKSGYETLTDEIIKSISSVL